MRNRRIYRQARCGTAAAGGPAAAGVPGLRLRRHRHHSSGTGKSRRPEDRQGQGPGPRPGGPRPQALRRHHRHRAHPLGHPRRAQRRQRPPAPRRGRARSPSSTTASSTTPPSCAPSSPPTASSSPPRPTPRSSPTSSPARRPTPWRRRSARRCALVEGTYGIAVLHADFPDRIVVARNGSPVVLGIGEKEMFVASDVAALVSPHPPGRHPRRRRDGHPQGRRLPHVHHRGLPHLRLAETVEWEAESYDMGGHDTYMHKEISEQADAVDRVLRGRIDDRFATVHLGGLNLDAREARGVRRVKILGCGSAYHAGMIGAQLIEELARIPADAEPASEFRYRNAVVDPDTLYIAVSQSGETYDTLAAVQELKRKGARVLGVVNVVGSRHRPRDGRRRVRARRARGLRRLHQVLHQHRGRLRAARPAPRPDPRPVGRRRQADHRGPAQAARADRRDPARRGARSRSSPRSTRRPRA